MNPTISDKVIVSRHPGAIQYLKKLLGDDIPIISEAKEEDVKDKVVYGNISFFLASKAVIIWALEFETPPRGKEYSLEEMEKTGVQLKPYVVFSLDNLPLATLIKLLQLKEETNKGGK